MPEFRLAVLGSPVSHSRSPRIHSMLLDLAGLSGTYEAIEANEPRLVELVEGMRLGLWTGFNVTMPLKEAAARLAEDLSPVSRRARSVNTLHLVEGHVAGTTTDASTFQDLYASPLFASASAIHILGAGGAAAAALAVAAESRRPVFVSARRREAAQAVVRRLGGEPLEWGTEVSGSLLVNATPLGMRGESLPPQLVEAAAGLIDLPYGEGVTPAVEAAKTIDVPVVDGLEFLVRQAIESFNLWTGSGLAFHDVAPALRKI